VIAYWIKRSIKYKVIHNGTMSKLLAPTVHFTRKKPLVCFAVEISKVAFSLASSFPPCASRRRGDGILPASSSDHKRPVSDCLCLVKFLRYSQIYSSEHTRTEETFRDSKIVFIITEFRVSGFWSYFEHSEITLTLLKQHDPVTLV